MAAFCKRHYEAIATAIQETKTDIRQKECNTVELLDGVEYALDHLADMFARDNGIFKRDRFIAACEPNANVRARS